ncbi:DUF4136 domain-containing protein [Alteromonas oceanisediminis]|uniref:DUF4136 domain-containing protein n=1 Tax=Alteromonas oceanisediminis TaxID=2836180 RepID=UPI001BDA2E88|nr:DUF4136 domain-containing protein [Alteromonas oceanisediminis]MBT0585243.1 DUF4136 domain-containing protein [Alteromonas oceanisediminis]
MIFRVGIAAVVLVLLSACASAPRVHTDFDTASNFAQYKTFAFAPDSAEQATVTTLLSKRVRDALERHLVANGHTKTSDADADFLVAYHTSYEKRIDVDTYYTAWGIRPYWGYDPLFRGHIPQTRVREYKVGTLVVDIIDADKKAVVWSSSAENTLSKHLSPEEREEKINTVVAAMLAEFPPVP